MNLEPSCEVKQSGGDTVAEQSTSWTLACSLSSILTMNCRSKAEAFAKRLHTRLKSLGGEVTGDERSLLREDTCAIVSDTLCNNGRPVTVGFSRSGDLLFVKDKQDTKDESLSEGPCTQGSPHDSDIFYEFGLESPQSPVDTDYPLNVDDNLFFKSVDRPMKDTSPDPIAVPPVQVNIESGYTFSTPTENLSPECDTKQVLEDSEISEYFDPDSLSDQISCASLSIDQPDLPREDLSEVSVTSGPAGTGSGRRSRFSKRRWGEQAPSPDLAQGQTDKPSQYRDDAYASESAESRGKDGTCESSADSAQESEGSDDSLTENGVSVDDDAGVLGHIHSETQTEPAFPITEGELPIIITEHVGMSSHRPSEVEISPAHLFAHSGESDLPTRNEIQAMFRKSDSSEDEKFVWRRSKSLKSFKTPPGTPGGKKIVRFADVLGLDLEDVRTFLDEVPVIPQSAFTDLKQNSEPENTNKYDAYAARKPVKCLIPAFQQPGGILDFMDRVKSQKVCLENAVMMDDMVVKGVIRVHNLDYHKSVFVRYTLDGWKSYHDLYGSYVQGSCDGFSDKFQFSLYAAHYLDIGQRLEFSICYQTLGQRYWDNNNGQNYIFRCFSNGDIGNSSLKGI